MICQFVESVFSAAAFHKRAAATVSEAPDTLGSRKTVLLAPYGRCAGCDFRTLTRSRCSLARIGGLVARLAPFGRSGACPRKSKIFGITRELRSLERRRPPSPSGRPLPVPPEPVSVDFHRVTRHGCPFAAVLGPGRNASRDGATEARLERNRGYGLGFASSIAHAFDASSASAAYCAASAGA